MGTWTAGGTYPERQTRTVPTAEERLNFPDVRPDAETNFMVSGSYGG